MIEGNADIARAAGLERALALFPDEIAAAARLAAEQAAALASLSSVTPPLTTVDATKDAARPGPASARSRHADEGEPLHYRTMAVLAAGFAAGTLTPLVLLEALLARIDAFDPVLHSFVVVDRHGARAAAAASAARWAAGGSLGPLDGMPVGIKDVIDVAGLPTRCHSALTQDRPAAADAAVVATLRAGGAVIVGKLATHEYAIGGPAFDLPFPPARNPWNPAHHPGGSSSGGGAAVAAGLVPLAIGTDTAGSVRHPASVCGVVGLKPGRGVLPLDGIVPLAATLDHVGLLTRSAEDMRIVARALGMPLAAVAPGRIGYVRHFHTRDMIATPATAAALDRVAGALGAVEVALPPLGDFALINRLILQSEGFAFHAANLRARPEGFSALTRVALLPGAFTGAATLRWAHHHRHRLTAAVDAAFREIDVLVTASSMEPACRIDDRAEVARTYMLQARSPFNVTGHPALAMMVGLSDDGLPLSVQFVTRMGEEGRLLAAAAAWERAMGGPIAPPIF